MTTETLPTIPTSTAASPGQPPASSAVRIPVLEVGFDGLSMPAVLAQMERFIQERRPRQVCLGNAYTVSLAQTDLELRTLLADADLVLADGMSIVWGSRWIQLHIPGRIAGPDLMAELCSLSAQNAYRIFLLGSTDENLTQLQDVLTTRWPGLVIAGSYSPPFADRLSEPENVLIFEKLAQAKPDILFVSMSAPKQEKWIADHLSHLQAPLCIGVGAAFDFLSGRIPRAPAFFQKSGLEWLYRLWREPSRLWKRYILGNLIFLSLLARQSIRLKLGRPAPVKP